MRTFYLCKNKTPSKGQGVPKINPQKIIRNKSYYRNRLQILLTYLNLRNSSILDLGCGEMILYDLVKDQIKSYLGIDQISFTEHEHFISGNILDKDVLKDQSADFIFLLGVLDHLTLDEKRNLMEMCKDKFHKSIIISQRNPKSFINFVYRSKAPVIEIVSYFENHSVSKLQMLKIPYTNVVFDLSKSREWIKNFCTEIVYIVSEEFSVS